MCHRTQFHKLQEHCCTQSVDLPHPAVHLLTNLFMPSSLPTVHVHALQSNCSYVFFRVLMDVTIEFKVLITCIKLGFRFSNQLLKQFFTEINKFDHQTSASCFHCILMYINLLMTLALRRTTQGPKRFSSPYSFSSLVHMLFHLCVLCIQFYS